MRFINGFIGHDASFDYNDLGHRCKNLTEINLQNYILFAGDGATVAGELPIEQTYPYLISQKLKTNYYNIAINYGGLEVSLYNLVSWFSNVKQKPKALVICSEFLNSITVTDNSFNEYKHLDYSFDITQDIYAQGKESGYYMARTELTKRLLYNTVVIPTYQIILKDREPLFTANSYDLNLDTDKVDHIAITDWVVEKYKAANQRVKP